MRFSDYITNPDLFVFPMIGLIAFLAVFLVASWRAMRMNKDVIKHCASMPLDLSEQESESIGTTTNAGEES